MMPFMTQPAVAPACYVPQYQPAGSLVFDGIDNLLTFTPAANGNLQKSCIDAFVQVFPGQSTVVWSAIRGSIANNDHDNLRISGSGALYGYFGDAANGVGSVYGFQSTAQFRSPGWLHVRTVIDTAQPAPEDRFKVFVNGVDIPLTWWDRGIIPRYYEPRSWNNAGVLHALGGGFTTYYHQGALCEWIWTDNFIPPVRWETNIHGVLVPKVPALKLADYGTNGCFLDFSDPLNPGKDVSGKGNHWKAVGFDATGKDSVAGSPTNVYATGNPLIPGSAALSNGGLTATWTSGGAQFLQATLPVRAPIYFEVTADNAVSNGVNRYPYVGFSDGVTGVYLNGNAVSGSVNDGDVLGVATDGVSAWVRKNGVWLNGDPTLGGAPTLTLPTDGLVYPFAAVAGSAAGEGPGVATINFGQRPFNDAPPSGFKPLCTDNLPEPDIKDPGEAFAQVATTGAQLDALLKSTTGHWNGAPYVEIVKRRDASEDWRVRFSDDPGNAWATNTALAKAAAPALAAAGNYVGYRLRVGARYGVWTAEVDHVTGTATTVSHGLNNARNAVICTRVSAGGGDRYFRHPDLAAGHLLKLNSNALSVADGTLTAFGATNFQVAANAPSGTYRVIVLAQRDGYLDLANYTGNGVVDGPFAVASTAPLLWMCKRVNGSQADHYQLIDATRAPFNPASAALYPNSPSAEAGGCPVDLDVGGVKIRGEGTSVYTVANAPNSTYVTIAIGRPIGGVCVAPVPAR